MGFVDYRYKTKRFGFVYMRGDEMNDCSNAHYYCAETIKCYRLTFLSISYSILFAHIHNEQVNTDPPVKSFHSLKGKRHESLNRSKLI